MKTDPRFNAREKRIDNQDELMPLVRAEFEKQPTAHWVAQLTEADVMNAEVQTYGDFMADEHTKVFDAIAYIDHAGAGTMPMPNIPGLPKIDGPSAMTHAPHLGEHSTEILAEWGYSDDAIADLIAKKAVALAEEEAAAE